MTGGFSRLVLLGLGGAFILLPLGLGQPGLPMSLRADETSFYFLARSLASEGDAVVDVVDIDRIYREMPYAGRERLMIGTDDDWQTARWAVPPLYSFALVPAVSLLRINGAFAFNAGCFVLALALLGRHLTRTTAGQASVGWVLAAAALLLSGAFAYVWWIHPASLYLLLVTMSFAMGWPTRVDPASYSSVKSGLRLAVAGACIGLCAVDMPWLGVLLPALLLRHRGSLRRLAALLVGTAGGTGIALLTSWLVLGHLQAGSFTDTALYDLTTPDSMPWLEEPGESTFEDGLQPAPGPGTSARQVLLSLVDRRRGLLLLFPFAALFVLATRRRLDSAGPPADTGLHDPPARWALAAGLVTLVLTRAFSEVSPLDLERFGDPVLAAAWPAFFFLPAVMPSVRAILLTIAVSSSILVPTLFTPFGAPVAKGDAHHATRGWPSRLPMGLEEVSEAAGWTVFSLGGPAEENLRLWAPAYATDRRSWTIAVLGGERVEMWLEATRPVPGLHVEVRNYAPGNRLTVASVEGRRRHRFAGETTAERTRFRLPLEDGWRRARRTDDSEVWVTPLEVTTTTGEKPQWRAGISESYYVGAELTFVGSDDYVARDVWGVRWEACGAPPTARPGEALRVLARLRNVSDADWITAGPVSVRLAHRWKQPDATPIESPHRAKLDGPVAAGEETLVWVDVVAPETPGIWQLEIEPVFELVAWFSDQMDPAAAAFCTAEITVEP
ncbi:MAG: hypothetical protein MPN21_10625 [Thermoanaerobaculia bacterium]|nr:hypothetical protein [Thermoanaerobaculia bacterium]